MTSSDLEREVLSWRKARLERLTARDGWLSLVGKVHLEPGVHRVGSDEALEVVLPAGKAPAQLGTFLLDGGRVSFTAEASAEHQIRVRRAGSAQPEPVRGTLELRSDARGAADRLLCGDLALEIMQRGDSFAVRVRDLESAARLAFRGIDAYPIQPRWRIEARLTRYVPERRIELVYETGAHESYVALGAASFELDGVRYQLDPVVDGDGARLFVVFADATNRDQTYGGGRFLYAPMPEGDRVLLDFNQAFNPPCAFTPYATCPLPPPQNRLALRIEAGEKRP